VHFEDAHASIPATETHVPRHYSPLVPAITFFTVCLGPAGSGKTTTLLSLLKTHYHQKFDRIFLFNPVSRTDPAYDALDLPPERVHKKWSNKTIQDLINEKEEWVGQWKENGALIPPATDLFIIDDTYGKGKTLRALEALATMGRKVQINVWFIAHRWKRQVTPTIRRNLSHVLCFELPNADEYEDFRKEIKPRNMAADEFDRAFDEATHDKYGFFYVNQRAPPATRFAASFNKVFVFPQLH
jgi:energy-coupling factor transporter ATP-binding protein EcfA2